MIAPSEVGAAAKRLEKENLRFRRFLKNRADCDELDQQFLKLHQELFAQYDCRECRNCCRAYNIELDEQEIDSIAAFLSMDKQQFIDTQLVPGTTGGHEIASPCRFLHPDGSCELESCKPQECRGFPYTDRPERLFSLFSILSSAEVCPVVFELLERLKDIYHFRR